MRRKILPVLIAVASLLGLNMVVQADEAEVKAAADQVKDKKLKDYLMSNIDIFGKGDLPAIYILMPGSVGDEDIQGSLLTRDFSRDAFFMQNIDREEFEMKVTLREINGDDEDKKREVKH